MRQILGDRWSGGVIAALAGYFLLLQAFVAAFTCGMTVPVEAGPHFVLCQPSLMTNVGASAPDEGEPSSFCHECPCVICQGSDADLTVALAPGNDLGLAYTLLDPAPVALTEETDTPGDPSRLGLAPDPRGPPHLFV